MRIAQEVLRPHAASLGVFQSWLDGRTVVGGHLAHRHMSDEIGLLCIVAGFGVLIG
jgi:hypothetical protein